MAAYVHDTEFFTRRSAVLATIIALHVFVLWALASGLAQSNEASVIGGEHLSLAGATLLNAYLITAVTMCDVHRETMTHVTPEVMPATRQSCRERSASRAART